MLFIVMGRISYIGQSNADLVNKQTQRGRGLGAKDREQESQQKCVKQRAERLE